MCPWIARCDRVPVVPVCPWIGLCPGARVPGPATGPEVQKARSDTLAGSCSLSFDSPTVGVKAGA